MNELKTPADNARNESASNAGLDAQLAELIECVWACEVAARREAHIDAAIRRNASASMLGGVMIPVRTGEYRLGSAHWIGSPHAFTALRTPPAHRL